MSEILQYNSKAIQDFMVEIEKHKYNPSGIQRVIYDVLDEITDGSLEIVDPTNPFIFLLESSAVNTAVAINENLIHLRKLYPNLAQNELDLYHHMADVDYLDRFSKPSTGSFIFNLQINNLEEVLVRDDSINAYKGTIPRNTEIVVSDITYSLQYPINVFKYDNGVIQVMYDTTEVSPLYSLSTNIIDYKVKTNVDGTSWLFFTVPMSQFHITTTQFPVQLSTMFRQTIDFEDDFYFCRVYSKDSSGSWVELATTHSEQVYDIDNPTAILQVANNQLTVTIPTIYTNTELVADSVRVDVYQTKGSVSLNLSNYKLNAFTTNLKAVDQAKDLNAFTVAMNDVSLFAFSTDIINNGSAELGFEQLKNRVIDNSLGSRNLPVTNAQLEAYIGNTGFELVKDIDVITNRIFLATKRLPSPVNTRLITAANMGIGTIVVNKTNISLMSSVVTNGDRQTILSNSLFEINNGIVRLLDQSEIDTLLSNNKATLVSTVNNGDYGYTPYHYVLDSSSNEFQMRAYDLDRPTMLDLSFDSQNETLQLIANTNTYSIVKVPNGYEITIAVKSGNFYKELADGEVGMQIGFMPVGEDRLVYFNGVNTGLNEDNERIFKFSINTDYDIDNNDSINLTNGKMFDNNPIDTQISLSSKLHIFYTTTSITNDYVTMDADELLGSFILPNDSVVITYETIDVTLGYSLKNLWTRSRVIPTGLDYQTHPVDIPLYYTEVVYEIDPITNSIFSTDVNGDLVYNILHNIGDPVLDTNSDPVYKHRAGDVVLDINGDPVINQALSSNTELDILLIDGKYYFTDDVNYLDYKKEVSGIITDWVIDDLSLVQDTLLEQTKLYFYPKNNLGLIEAYPNANESVRMSSELSFTIDLYVSNNVYLDNVIRDNLSLATVRAINNYITDNSVIKLSDISEELKQIYGDSVETFNLLEIGTNADIAVLRTKELKDGFTLNKKLVLQQDNSIILTEDVDVVFHKLT